ncbi:MAG: DinB family protein, partial [Bryobacteraceae bacterium]|nr:DinB family protein [Bryobacteraceae bacterium]
LCPKEITVIRFVALSALSTLALLAQDNPLSTEAQQSWARTKGNIIAAAEKMPEDAYGFKPAPESQSFQVLVAHTADSAMGACSAFNGARKQAGAASKTSKAEVVDALKSAMAECDTAYGSLTDAKASEMIEGRRGRTSRLGALYGNTIHLEHEYAQMAVHFRLKGLVPPSSEGRGGMGKKKKQ